MVPGDRSKVYQVRLDGPAGRLLGSVTDHGDHWQASVVVDNQLHTQPFLDREQAAVWLLSVAPRTKRYESVPTSLNRLDMELLPRSLDPHKPLTSAAASGPRSTNCLMSMAIRRTYNDERCCDR